MNQLSAVQVLLNPSQPFNPRKMLFSPGKPRSAILLFEDAPPELHNLRNAGLKAEMADADIVEINSNSRIGRLQFRDAASAAAFRPGHDELAIVFGQGDTYVHRVNQVNGSKLEPIYFENPVSVAYSSDGNLLVAGSSDGTVSIFRLGTTEDTEFDELRCVHLPAAARALGFDELSGLVLVATEHNDLVEFPFNAEEDQPLRRGVQLEDGCQYNSMQLNTIAYGDDGVIAFAGVGNEIWLANSYDRQGGCAPLREATRVYFLQFVPGKSILVAHTDIAVHIMRFEMNADHRPVFDKRVTLFRPLSPRITQIGCQHYGNMICIASVLPSQS